MDWEPPLAMRSSQNHEAYHKTGHVKWEEHRWMHRNGLAKSCTWECKKRGKNVALRPHLLLATARHRNHELRMPWGGSCCTVHTGHEESNFGCPSHICPDKKLEFAVSEILAIGFHQQICGVSCLPPHHVHTMQPPPPCLIDRLLSASSGPFVRTNCSSNAWGARGEGRQEPNLQGSGVQSGTPNAARPLVFHPL